MHLCFDWNYFKFVTKSVFLEIKTFNLKACKNLTILEKIILFILKIQSLKFQRLPCPPCKGFLSSCQNLQSGRVHAFPYRHDLKCPGPEDVLDDDPPGSAPGEGDNPPKNWSDGEPIEISRRLNAAVVAAAPPIRTDLSPSFDSMWAIQTSKSFKQINHIFYNFWECISPLE